MVVRAPIPSMAWVVLIPSTSTRLQTDVIADFEDGSDLLRFDLATADNFNDFTIFGNGTHLMSVVLTATGDQVVVQGNGTTNVTLTAADFLFV